MPYGFNNDKSKYDLTDLIKVQDTDYTSQTYNGNVITGRSIAIPTIEGYTPVGVVGVRISAADTGSGAIQPVSELSVHHFFISSDGNSAYVTLRNNTSTQVTAYVSARVLYAKS